MRAHLRHAAPHGGDPPRLVQRIEVAQQGARGGHGAGGGRIEEGQLGRRRAPGGAIQRQARKLGFQDLGPVLKGQAAVQRLRPQADGDAGRGAARAPGALLGGGATDAERRQPRQAGGGVEPWRAARGDGLTPLMVLITKMMMVTSRAQPARSHHLSPEGQARASRRQGLDRGQLWTSDGKTDVDDAATQVACVTTGSGERA
jgi:hypothetical protein